MKNVLLLSDLKRIKIFRFNFFLPQKYTKSGRPFFICTDFYNLCFIVFSRTLTPRQATVRRDELICFGVSRDNLLGERVFIQLLGWKRLNLLSLPIFLWDYQTVTSFFSLVHYVDLTCQPKTISKCKYSSRSLSNSSAV